MTRERQSIDLFVYGRLIGCASLRDLQPAWREATAATGVKVQWPEDVDPLLHAGPLPIMVELTDAAPRFLSTNWRVAEASRGSVDLFVEQFEPSDPGSAGLEDLPRHLAERMLRSTFCLILTLGASSLASCCIGAFFMAVGLARVSDGVVADLEEEIYWDADQALQNAEHYLTRVMDIGARSGQSSGA